MPEHISIVHIPAYNASHAGLIIELELKAMSDNAFLINSTGEVAIALQRSVRRIIEIMSSMKKSWRCLEYARYWLTCHSHPFIVRDAKSAGMALSIALLNICRSMQGKPQVQGLSGTGVLRVDGSFDCSHREEEKYRAARKNLKYLNKFITPHESASLLDLENLMNSLC